FTPSAATESNPLSLHDALPIYTLGLAWAFQTNQAQPVKSTPILVDGIVYLTAPDNLWALDARSGREIWRYQHPANDAFHIGHRRSEEHTSELESRENLVCRLLL